MEEGRERGREGGREGGRKGGREGRRGGGEEGESNISCSSCHSVPTMRWGWVLCRTSPSLPGRSQTW